MPETLGGAVLRALEGDTSRRYPSADEFAGGLRLGLEGEDVTLPMDEGTAATRVLGGEPATRRLDETGRTEFRPIPPTAPPGGRAAAPGGPSPIRPAKRGVLALRQVRPGDGRAGPDRAAVATAVILATDRASGVHAKEVAGDTVDKVVSEFKELVEKNTE